MNADNFEIERKFLIKYPEESILDSCTDVTEIIQTYLLGSEKGFSERVRKRGKEGKYIYTHTSKMHVTDVRRIELENEIGEQEYSELLLRADPERRMICKKRYCLMYKNQLFEIDIYPFWNDRAVMELELSDEEQSIVFPENIEVIKEVTDDKRYTNASIARSIPFDAI